MNSHQEEKLDLLREELKLTGKQQSLPLPLKGETDGYLFTEVEGVTVLITTRASTPRGGYIVPCLRNYPETGKPGETSLDAAIQSRELFEKQSKRDMERPTRKRRAGNPEDTYSTGHFNPMVDTKWRCMGEVKDCPCLAEDTTSRKKRALHRVGKPRIFGGTARAK